MLITYYFIIFNVLIKWLTNEPKLVYPEFVMIIINITNK